MQEFTIREKGMGTATPVLELIHKYANQYAKCQEKRTPRFAHGIRIYEREGGI